MPLIWVDRYTAETLGQREREVGLLPGGPGAETSCSTHRVLGSTPAQGTRPHMPQLRPSIAK